VGRPGPAALDDLATEVRAHWGEATALGLARERREPVIAPGLARVAPGDPTELVVVWVFLTDKGIGTRASFDRALADARDRFSPRVVRRRESLGPDLGLGFTDLPVHAPYVARLRDEGYRVRRVSRWLNAVSLEVPADRLSRLGEMGFARFVQPVLFTRREPEPLDASAREPVVSPLGAPTPSEVAFYGVSFDQLDQIEVPDLHAMGYTGAGVMVMMIDTGFRNQIHPALSCLNVVAEYDFIQEDGETANEPGDDPDQHTHGTGVWAVLGGYDPGSLIGPAFGADFVLAKTEDVSQEVHAEEDNYVAALEWADTLGVDVTSASLAYLGFDDGSGYAEADLDGDTAVITVAIDIAASKGIACVNSVGNAGPDTTSLWTPADADTMLAVGAVNSSGMVAFFSGRGPTADNRIKPEIAARGSGTVWLDGGSLTYGFASGTSLAAPLIGGLLALLKEAHPGWTGYDLRAAVIGTGSTAGAPNNDIGYGIARGTSALTFGGSTPSPPRMTLPFELLEPGDSTFVSTVTPTLVWSSSAAANVGDAAAYSVIFADNPTFADPDTAFVGSDTTYTFVLAIPSSESRWWKVQAVGNQGFVRKSMNEYTFTVGAQVGLDSGPPALPPVFLAPAFPNPMTQATTLGFRVPAGEPAVLEIISVGGRLVRRFELTGTGEDRAVSWDGRNRAGQETSSGIYFYRLVTRNEQRTRRLVRLP
jgi:hypothetical protein